MSATITDAVTYATKLTRRWGTITAAALVLAMGCGSDSTGPTHQSVSGTWSGVTGAQVLTMTLVENGGVVTGSGTLTNTPTGTRAQTVTGTFASPTLDVTLSSGSVQPVALHGTVGGNSMAGSLTGSGFTGDAITLTRQ